MATTAKHTQRTDYQTPEMMEFVNRRLAVESKACQKVLAEMEKNGLPAINIGPLEGRLLEFLTRSVSAKRAVEIGTLGGYSAIWIANALPPSGKLFTFEFDEKHADVAERCLADAGLSKKVQVIRGDANAMLAKIEPIGPFDIVFIDADKVSYPKYLKWAVKNLRPGGLVVADNAFLFGKLHLKPEDAGEDAPAVHAMHEFLRLLADETEFATSAMIPTGEGLAVGIKR